MIGVRRILCLGIARSIFSSERKKNDKNGDSDDEHQKNRSDHQIALRESYRSLGVKHGKCPWIIHRFTRELFLIVPCYKTTSSETMRWFCVEIHPGGRLIIISRDPRHE